jgi:TetR/AcrR family transcriptional regulator, cholesterol catabolism regulator
MASITTAETRTAALERDSLTAAQRQRRDRIIEAAVALASKGGYDGVQMRDVAERAGVALGTLYRYFPSKVHLLVAAMREQTEQLRSGMAKRPPAGETAEEQVLNILRRATRALERDPNLTSAMLRALMFADPSAASDADAVSGNVMNLIVGAINTGEPTAEDIAIARVLEQVWHSSLLSWLSGRASSRDLYQNLEVATRLLLAGRS